MDQEPGTEEQTDQQGLGSRQASQTGRDRQREADRRIRSLGTSLWTSQQVKIRTGVKMVKVTL